MNIRDAIVKAEFTNAKGISRMKKGIRCYE